MASTVLTATIPLMWNSSSSSSIASVNTVKVQMVRTTPTTIHNVQQANKQTKRMKRIEKNYSRKINNTPVNEIKSYHLTRNKSISLHMQLRYEFFHIRFFFRCVTSMHAFHIPWTFFVVCCWFFVCFCSAFMPFGIRCVPVSQMCFYFVNMKHI